MARDLQIANRLRAAGLIVIEVAGWQSAGKDTLWALGSVNHHTAGGASGETPSLSTVIYGRSDLPGPLCNVYQSRDSAGYDVAYVVASGTANHAGEGSWKGLSGNSSMYGLEVEHTGTAPIPTARQNIAARIHEAMFRGDPAYVCQHREWTSRKPDMATNVPGDEFRQRVRDARALRQEEPDDMTPEEHAWLERAVKAAEGALAKATEVYERQVPEQTVRDDIVLNREIATAVGVEASSLADLEE